MIDRKHALKADTFYMHLLGFTKRPMLVLTKPADFVEVMQKEGKLNLCVDMPDTINATNGPGNLQMLSGARHNFLRKIFAKLLHPATLERFLPYFYEEFDKMWTKLEAASGEVIIQDAICEAQFFLMAKILYGMTPENTDMEILMQLKNDFELQMKGHFAHPKSKTHREAKEASQRIRRVLNPRFDAVLDKRSQMIQTDGDTNNVMDDDVPVGNAMESIADALLKDSVQNDEQIRSDVYDNLNLLLEASHGTTSELFECYSRVKTHTKLQLTHFYCYTPVTNTTSMLFYLNHPDNAGSLQKLREEMHAFSNAPPMLSDLKNETPIADGAIKETMRLAPIVGNIAYACKDDTSFTFKGQKLQGPIAFFMAFAHNYSDPKYFPNPDSFIPERWISGAKEEVSNEARASFRPFGMGRHVCLGYKLAELVMKSALFCFARDNTRVIKFDSETVKRKSDIFPAYSISDGFPGRVVSLGN